MPRQHNFEIDAGGRQRNRLQLARLFAANSPGVPQIYRLRYCQLTGTRLCALRCVLSRKYSDHDDNAGSGNCSDHDFAPMRMLLLAISKKPAHAGGACGRVIDTRVGERYVWGFSGQVSKEFLVWTWPRRSRFPCEHASLMLLRNPLLKAVLSV